MARRKGSPVHGWLILDKPQSMTSTHALNKVKRLFDADKAGHAGTLDPLATGVLPVAFGEATKTIPHVMDSMKGYRFLVRWGTETDTDDAEGTAVKESAERPTREAIEALLPQFRGTIMQTPPRYSAIKIAGERAYDLARDGEQFDIAPRPVEITRLEIVEAPGPDACVFEAECGKGTYVRAIARDLGRLLGCYGHVAALRRTAVGPFTEDVAMSLETPQQGGQPEGAAAPPPPLLPVEAGLTALPALRVSSADAGRLARGQAVLLRGRDAPIMEGWVSVSAQGSLIALAEIEKGELRPRRIFNLPRT